MPARKATATLSGMVDDFSEDEFAQGPKEALFTPDSAVENRAPARKGRAKAESKPIAPKPTKARATTRRASGTSVLGPKKAAVEKKTKASGKRTALKEKQANASDTEEVDEFAEEEPEPIHAPAPAKTTKRGRPAKAKIEENIKEPMPAKKRGKAANATAAKKETKSSKRGASPSQHEVVPETQGEPEAMEVEDSIEIEEVPETQPPVRAAQRSARQQSLQPILSSRARRLGSASDTERGSDPMLRRKLGEMTKKFENLDVRYKQLREVGVQDKETNFEKLKRSTDKREQDQNNVIASLKKQLEEQRALANESKALRTEVQSLKSENQQLTAKTKSLSTSLTESQNEAKALSTKLAASRAQSAEPSKVPGSAMKQQRPALGGSADAAKETQIRQLKEDLYSDLTGLIIRGIKKVDGEDVYDCIQTGRNGTLHFHLTVNSDEKSRMAGINYEDVEFAYTPHLDSNRDRDLLEILPDYLMEEICFPRNNAAKFYAKIVECITKKIIIEE